MGAKVVYTCDKCKEVLSTPKGALRVRVVTAVFTSDGTELQFAYASQERTECNALFCVPCAERAGFMNRLKEPVKEPLTLDEWLREIIQEEISNSQP